MEFSDTEEEIIDLNAENTKEDDKKEKALPKRMKWVKSSLESISQMARSEAEETEYAEINNLDQNEENQENNNDNDEENLSDYNNNENNDKNKNKENKNNNNDKKENKKKVITEKKEETKNDSNKVQKVQKYIFIWDEGGNSVKLIGTFSNWKQQYDMKKDEKDQIFKISLPLSNEKYQYKFIVDGVWKCSQKQETIDDGKGNINNFLDLSITNIKGKEEKIKKKKKISKKNSKLETKKKTKEKIKKDNRKNDLNLKKEKKQTIKIFEYGNEYPDSLKLTEPNHSENIGKSFNINNMSKQKKIGNPKYYKF